MSTSIARGNSFSLAKNEFARIVFKTLALFCGLVLGHQVSFAQIDSTGAPTRAAIMFDLGVSDLVSPNSDFDRWTFDNYKLTEDYKANIHGSIGILYKQIYFGVNLNAGSNTRQSYAILFGAKLTGQHTPVSAWVLLEYGYFSANFKNIAPVHYTRTPDQVGQNLELLYFHNYIGITSKNYLNFIHFTFFNGKRTVACNPGFFISAGYQPGSEPWLYGYYNTKNRFTSVKITSMPVPNALQVSLGFFVGFQIL